MAVNRDTVWIIVGKHGAYCDSHTTKRAAIGSHVNALDQQCFDDCEGVVHHPTWRPLSEAQKLAWQTCKKKGDRAVKATLTWKD